MAEGIAAYKTFISALLDITDNLVAGEVVPPAGVVRHDEDDTYLVVAADKGTATFSDIANAVAESYNFWLGDAFASGGSAGYDHKGMGITARGAWESVKRHFRELGHDTQTQDFTTVGVGDMSGDVFGNGMLLSEHIRLVAAFDHRHIFIDPTPDAATSYAERRRLFDLPRSSWADYDTGLLSPGGGVHPRSAKSIPLNAHVREALGIESGVAKMTPADLMQAILKAPVDLVWNGGIGTYVKSSAESNADVGDKANDAIRVNGEDLRAKVVGEGGNLGLTQLGRIEYARSGGDGSGGKINTDAIDNSAGVDTSDHEVNIKILLNGLVTEGDLTVKQRNQILASMTDEVGVLVLRNNYAQNTALANAVAQAPSLLHAHQRFMRRLGRDGHLNRALEFLPTDRQVRELLNGGKGLSQPELAVLLAYTKITAAQELISTDLPDDPYLQKLVHAYFPKQYERALLRGDRRARAAARDHHHGPRQRHGEHRWFDLPAPAAGGDRGLDRGDRAGTGSGPGDLRPGRGLGRRRGAGQQGRGRHPDQDQAPLAPSRRARRALAAGQPPAAAGPERDHRLLHRGRGEGLGRPAEDAQGRRPGVVPGHPGRADGRGRAGGTGPPGRRVLLRLPGAGHRGHRGPYGQGPDGGRRGVLRPREPAGDHPG